MKMYIDDTIAAVSTTVGDGGIAIVRISGDSTFDILKKIFRTNKNVEEIKSHTINYGHIIDNNGDIADEVLVSVMLAPKTYTRQDIAEINCHGGFKTIEKILSIVLENGARLAQPGEFTKRAFLNGRIDLSQAEAVIDIINSKTELARLTAVNNLSGTLSNKIQALKDEILNCIAHIEASIDYPEHDLEEFNLGKTKEIGENVLNQIETLIKNADKGKIIKEGVETVIIGRPNVGKSSLLNMLLDEERAIVTDIPGTTRDMISEFINVNNIPLKIIDTAGIRDSDDVIEQIGVLKSKQLALSSDLVLLVLDSSSLLTQEDIDLINFVKDKNTIIILNKVDLPKKIDMNELNSIIYGNNLVEISAKNKFGLDNLLNNITSIFFDGNINLREDIYIGNLRQKESLMNAEKSLKAALETVENGLTEEFVAIDLTDCYSYLGEITGDTVGEDIIDKIFSEFCLGK